MKAYYLKPTAPFHLQTGSLDHESVESFPKADTLSSALLYLWFRQYGNVPDFPKNLPFRLSSLMPAIKRDGAYIRCYPKPMNLSLQTDKLDHKIFKKIEFLTEPVFDKWRAGNITEADFPSSNSKKLWFDGKVWGHNSWDTGEKKLYNQHTRTRMVSDRITGQTTPFHFASTLFGEDILLYFLADAEDDFEPQFKAMLRMLGDEGLGADRTVGMGLFDVLETEKLSSSLSKEPAGWINLGIYNPAEHEVEAVKKDKSRYSLFNRYGWTSGKALRRQTVAVLGEGSFISGPDQPGGTIRKVLDPNDPKLLESDIQLNHPVYRDCQGYFLPCN